VSVYVWHVEGSLPPEPEHNWRRNINVTVLAQTLVSAAAATIVKHPGIELHKIFRDRMAHDLLVASDAPFLPIEWRDEEELG
jgi:hypothetical protein